MRLRCGTSSINGGSRRCTYGEGGSDLLIGTSWSCPADSRLRHSAPIPLSDNWKCRKVTHPSRWTAGGRPPCAHWPATSSPPSDQGADWFSIWSGRPSAEQSSSDPPLISRMILSKVRTPPSGLFPGRSCDIDRALSYSKFETRPGRSAGKPRGLSPLDVRITGGQSQFRVTPTSRIDVAAWANRSAGLYCEFLDFVARIK